MKYTFCTNILATMQTVTLIETKVRKNAKIRNRYDGKVIKTQENITHKRAKRLDLSQQVTSKLQVTDTPEWQR